MKKLIGMLVVVMLVVPAYGLNLLSEDFEGGSNGDDLTTLGWGVSWRKDGPPPPDPSLTGQLLIDSTTIDSGNSIRKQGGGNEEIHYRKAITPYTVGSTYGAEETVELTWVVESEDPGNVGLLGVIENGDNSKVWEAVFSSGHEVTQRQGNGWTWSGEQFVYAYDGDAADTVEMKLELTTTAISLYTRALGTASWTLEGSDPDTFATVGGVRVGIWSGGATGGFIDSISLDVVRVPEPATLGLLGVGGLLTLVRRRR